MSYILMTQENQQRKRKYCLGVLSMCTLIWHILGIWFLVVTIQKATDPAFVDPVKLKRAIEPTVIQLLAVTDDPVASAPLKAQIQSLFDDSPLTNAVLLIADQRGIHLQIQKGRLVSPSDVLWIASATKLITSTIVLRYVENGVISLDDHPQKYISWWTNDTNDPRSAVTLGQVLSFTSGFIQEHGRDYDCSKDDSVTLEECMQRTYNGNVSWYPGTSFYYGSNQGIAALMLQNATGKDWKGIFDEFKDYVKNVTGISLASSTVYNHASYANPMLGGGLETSVNDYNTMLSAIFKGLILNNQTFQQQIKDWTNGVVFEYSPAMNSINETWHYGLGCWIECPLYEYASPPCGMYGGSVSYSISSPGAFGFYPWINLDAGYYGIVGTSSLKEFVVRAIIGGVLIAIGVVFCCSACCYYYVMRRKRRGDAIPLADQ